MGIGVAVLILAFIGVVIYLRNQPAPADTNPAHKRTAADAAVVTQLANVPQSVWESVGKGSVVQNAFTYNSGQPPLKGGSGRPEFLYIGGEYCPYCAAERWAMVVALSRFGTFSNLSQIQSYEYNVPTFSFYGSSYSSQYVDFVPKEIKGNALDSSGQNYVNLETLTAAEQQTFQKYDSGQNFPFVDIGNLYTGIGASYDLTVLLDSKGNPLSHQTIASSLSDPKSAIAQGILGTANYMTAGICSVTNQQPSTVCNVPIIQQIQQAMSKAPAATSTPGATTTPGATVTPTKTSQIPGDVPLALAPAELRKKE
jgi:thiol-disulfide isomerase/thioredoxin